MKKKIKISGSLEDMVTYCTAVYDIGEEFDQERLNQLIGKSPIFEDKDFYTNVLGTLSKTTVKRKSEIFNQGSRIVLQIRYEILKTVDINLTEKDEKWIKNDIDHLISHFELLLDPFSDEE